MLRRTSLRRIVTFTPQNPVLENNAKHLGFASQVWVEADADRYWWSKLTQLKRGTKQQRATEIAIPRIHEYYNMDCVADEARPELEVGLPDPKGVHFSFSSRAPFSRSVSDEFESCARQRGYSSRFWLSSATVKSRRIKMDPAAKVTSVLFTGKGRFFNAEQFEHPERIEQTPISAYKRMPYGGPTLEALRADIEHKKYPTGLYFTLGQLELFDLTGRLKENAEPVEVTGEFGAPFNPTLSKHRLFNLDEVQKGEDLLDELNRFPVEDDTFLISGCPVSDEKLQLALQGARARYTSRYWVTKRDIEGRGYSLKPNARGVSRTGDEEETSRRREMTLLFYNVHQLDDPMEGYKLAGTRAVL